MIIAIITLIGMGLRLVLLNQSFWLDEGASLMFAKLPLLQLFESIKTDFHPPLFYGLLHFWLPVAGNTDWLIRLPFVVLATATIPALYLLCRELFGVKSRVPLVAAIFLAINPLHIYYSQELRMYSLSTLFVVLSWYFLIKKKYLAAGLINALGFFTFYGAVFSLISQVVLLIFDKPKDKIRKMLWVIAPTTILFLIWFPVFKVQLDNGEYLKSALPGWQMLSGTLTLKSLALIPFKFILGRISFSPQNIYMMVGAVISLVFLVIIANSYRDKKARALWFAALIPIMVGITMSLKTPVLGYWRFLFVLPFFLALVAAGIEDMPKIIFWGTVVWVCGVFLFSNLYFWNNTKFHREDWKGLSNFLRGKESQLLLAFPYKFAPLNYYQTGTVVVPMLDSGFRRIQPDQKFHTTRPVYYLDYLADVTDPNRLILKSIQGLKLKQTKVYNFNNLGQLYEFQPL